jgi:hypothetical protein
MKVLGLHGKQQNADVFHTRCSKLIAKAQRLKLVTLFHCIDGAHQLPLRAGDEVPMRSWYERQRNGVIIQDSLELSLQRIEAAWKEVGPFEGLLGFSMGGSMAAIVASLPARFPGLRFIVIAGAPDLDDRSLGYQLFEPPALRSLHLIGLVDRTVEPHSSHSLAAKFTAPQVVEHELGHCIPSKAAHIDCMLDFLQRMVRGPREAATLAATGTSAIPDKNQSARTAPAQKPQRKAHFCASDEVAALQSEEVEVLLAMYPDEIRFVAADWDGSGSAAAAASAASSGASYSAPSRGGDPCVSLHVSLSLDPQQFEPRAAEGFPQAWVGNIGLRFHFTAGYPLTEPPLVTATTGKLTLHDGFSDARVRSLESAVSSACCLAGGEAFAGEACVMLCIQAATDWFSTGLWRSPSTATTTTAAASARKATAAHHRGEEDSCSSDEDEDGDGQELPAEVDALAVEEAQEAEFIRLATAEACCTACKERQRTQAGGLAPHKHGGRGAADEQGAALLPPSARGVWTYTVGLVGKPSAGKSTFYNAVTRAALERGGRLMAEVAPHPFTTIEPNVGELHGGRIQK